MSAKGEYDCNTLLTDTSDSSVQELDGVEWCWECLGLAVTMPCIARTLNETLRSAKVSATRVLTMLVPFLLPDNPVQRLKDGLLAWSQMRGTPLNDSDIDMLIQTSMEGLLPSRCSSPVALRLCEAEGCPWFPWASSGVFGYATEMLCVHGWRHVLEGNSIALYLAILEKHFRDGVEIGRYVNAGYRELARMCQMGRTSIGRHLEILASQGLITIGEKGAPWGHSEDRDVVTTVTINWPVPLAERNLLPSSHPETLDGASLTHLIIERFLDLCERPTEQWYGIGGLGLDDNVFYLTERNRAIETLREEFGASILKKVGLLNARGRFRFAHHTVLFPWRDGERFVYLRGRVPDGSDIEPTYLTLGKNVPDLYEATAVESHSHVVLCSGMSDALSVLDLGLPAVGLPFPDSTSNAVVQRLRGKAVVLALPGDEEGDTTRFGLRKTFEYAGIEHTVVRLPDGKDLNDLLNEDRDDLRSMLVESLRSLGWEGE